MMKKKGSRGRGRRRRRRKPQKKVPAFLFGNSGSNPSL